MAIYREVNYTIAMETEWKVAHGPKGYAFAIKRDDNSDVCVLHNGLTPQDKALATLISATPDLLEAAKLALSAIQYGNWQVEREAYAKLALAIEKAEGVGNDE